MLYGQPTWLNYVLTAIRLRVVSQAKFPTEAVFSTLASDEDHTNGPARDRFVLIRPGQQWSANQVQVAGGGATTSQMTGSIGVNFLVRYNLDQELRSSRLLEEVNASVLGQFRDILKALHLFSPTNATDPTISILTQPMRIQSFDMLPRPMKQGSPWVTLSSRWEVEFRADLT